MTGAQALIASLQAEQVKHIFGYAGATICPAVEALAHMAPEIGYTLVRTEQNAGHMASGYQRGCGDVGVCMVTSGPGATNLITGIATAYMDSIPMIAITGQVPSHLLGRDIFQEVDISGACAPFSKHTYLVKDPKEIPRIVKEAFHIASTGRPGPVLIDLPVDVQQMEIGEFHYPEAVNIRSYRPSVKGNDFQLKRVAKAIAEGKRPVVCAGGGVFLANARAELKAWIEQTQLPLVTTMMGLSLLPSDHPQNLGMVGAHGNPVANRALAKSDLLILVGARVGDRAITSPDTIGERMDIIHIDVDPAEIGKNMTAAMPLVGDIKCILKQLLEHPLETSPENKENLAFYAQARAEERQKTYTPPQGIHPANFLRLFGQKLNDDAGVCVDVGQNQLFACKHLTLKQDMRLLTSGGLGTMGYALPCAVGFKVAQPQRQTAVICGDGSFQMSFNELSALVAGNLDVKIVLFQNNVLGLVHQIQCQDFTAPFGVALDGSPDFVTLASAYGLEAQRISQESQMSQGIDRFLAQEKASILIVEIDKNITTYQEGSV